MIAGIITRVIFFAIFVGINYSLNKNIGKKQDAVYSINKRIELKNKAVAILSYETLKF